MAVQMVAQRVEDSVERRAVPKVLRSDRRSAVRWVAWKVEQRAGWRAERSVEH